MAEENAPANDHTPFLASKTFWIGVSALIVSLFVMGCFCFHFKRKISKCCKFWPRKKGGLDVEKTCVRKFHLQELQKATNNFSKDFIVGSGAFGDVYVGSFEASEVGTLAIKKLHPHSCTSIDEFRNEVRLISKVKHENLVRLVGFCEESGFKRENIMVYEYVSNGSLLDYLMGREGRTLTWKQRADLAIGAAKGIAHLHDGVKPSIIHRDIKPSNILVTDKFEAKVSDFGLVRAGPDGDQSHVSSMVKGTPGYLDPAYCSSLRLGPYTDVYSFGVILLQLVSGRRVIDQSRGDTSVHIVDWARPSLKKGRVEEILDANLLFEECDMVMMLKMGQLGLRCVLDNPKERPRMSQVWQELETALQTRVHKLPCDEPCSQTSIAIDDVGLERFHEDMVEDSSNFHSPSLRRFEYSLSIDAAAKNLRGTNLRSGNESNEKDIKATPS